MRAAVSAVIKWMGQDGRSSTITVRFLLSLFNGVGGLFDGVFFDAFRRCNNFPINRPLAGTNFLCWVSSGFPIVPVNTNVLRYFGGFLVIGGISDVE